MTALQQIQQILGVAPDGNFGPVSLAALHALIQGSPAPGSMVHVVHASSFADPADVAAYRRAKAEGKSEQEALAVGDNGVGKWGDDTTTDEPMCALPPEAWEPFGSTAHGKKVIVSMPGKEDVTCSLKDTLPHGSPRIDLNPGAQKAFGLTAPFLVPASWRWA